MSTRQMKTKEGKALVEHHNTRKWASAKLLKDGSLKTMFKTFEMSMYNIT
jgi:hypothetical protein